MVTFKCKFSNGSTKFILYFNRKMLKDETNHRFNVYADFHHFNFASNDIAVACFGQ